MKKVDLHRIWLRSTLNEEYYSDRRHFEVEKMNSFIDGLSAGTAAFANSVGTEATKTFIKPLMP